MILIDATLLALKLLANTLPFMILGVILAELIVALRIVDNIAFFAHPITRFAHLRSECGASFMTAFLFVISVLLIMATVRLTLER